MSNLAERLKGIEKGGNEHTLVQVLRDLGNGSLKHEEIQQHYAQAYAPKVRGVMTAFQTGKLFVAQRQDFQAFLACDGLPQDIDALLEAKSTFWMAGVKFDSDLDLFGCLRIFSPPPSFRKKAMQGEGGLYKMLNDEWTRENSRYHWNWR